jgi:Asp-tRNA(Asn)/Glu-tRNA(Gln) amidotransferase A subunit family amidase
VNCALEIFPELALAQAAGLDDYYETHGRTVGPLHGLPISLKDQFRIKVCLITTEDRFFDNLGRGNVHGIRRVAG